MAKKPTYEELKIKVKALLKNGKVTDYEILLKDQNNAQSSCSLNAKLANDKLGKPEKIIGCAYEMLSPRE